MSHTRFFIFAVAILLIPVILMGGKALTNHWLGEIQDASNGIQYKSFMDNN